MRDRGEESIQVGEVEVTDRHMEKRGCVHTAFFLQRETRRHHMMKRKAAQESLPAPTDRWVLTLEFKFYSFIYNLKRVISR